MPKLARSLVARFGSAWSSWVGGGGGGCEVCDLEVSPTPEDEALLRFPFRHPPPTGTFLRVPP